jgi:hypothetical protein
MAQTKRFASSFVNPNIDKSAFKSCFFDCTTFLSLWLDFLIASSRCCLSWMFYHPLSPPMSPIGSWPYKTWYSYKRRLFAARLKND